MASPLFINMAKKESEAWTTKPFNEAATKTWQKIKFPQMHRSALKQEMRNILKMVKLLRLSYYSLNSNPKVVNPTTIEDAVAVEGVGH